MRVEGRQVEGSGFRVQGSEFRVWNLGFRAQGFGFRVCGQGSEITTMRAEEGVRRRALASRGSRGYDRLTAGRW